MIFEEYGTLENNFIDIIFNFSPFLWNSENLIVINN